MAPWTAVSGAPSWVARYTPEAVVLIEHGELDRSVSRKPRMPCHSDTIDGGKKRVSENFRSTFLTLFGVKTLFDSV